MRLIDADVLLYSIFKSCNTTEATINNAPTIDAVPVVHGEWITTKTYSHDGELYCSNCGEEAPAEYGRYTYIKSTYCPNCGAKMLRFGHSNGTT